MKQASVCHGKPSQPSQGLFNLLKPPQTLSTQSGNLNVRWTLMGNLQSSVCHCKAHYCWGEPALQPHSRTAPPSCPHTLALRFSPTWTTTMFIEHQWEIAGLNLPLQGAPLRGRAMMYNLSGSGISATATPQPHITPVLSASTSTSL